MTVPEWGSMDPPGFSATLGTPAPEQVVRPHPPPRGRQQLGRGERAAQLLPIPAVAESPLPLGHQARGSVDLLTPSFFSENSLHSLQLTFRARYKVYLFPQTFTPGELI